MSKRKKNPLPEAFMERLRDQFGQKQLQDMIEAFSKKRPTTFRVNPLKGEESELIRELQGELIHVQRHGQIPQAYTVLHEKKKSLEETEAYKEGRMYVQGFASMIPPVLLQVEPGQRVLDACAAPGGKTSQIAAYMQNEGHLDAVEQDQVRSERLQFTLKRQGAMNVKAHHQDIVPFCREAKAQGIFYDRILADVPCSAEGRIQFSESRSYRFWSEKNIRAHAKMQRRIVRAVMEVLAPGGIFVYSTCTLAPEEDEEMVDWILSEFPDMKVVPVEQKIPQSKVAKNGGLYVLPSVTQEGFFVCTFKKS